MKLTGTPEELLRELRQRYRHAPPLPNVHMQMLPWQMFALYALTWELSKQGGQILEIGSGFGGSAYMMAKAGPRVQIMSLTINEKEAAKAREFLDWQGCQNVAIQVASSGQFLESDERTWDMIFVDGDHKHMLRDLPWFNRVRESGLYLCHDYSPVACPPVYEAMNRLRDSLGRDLDVMLMDANQVGMAGIYRREGEAWA